MATRKELYEKMIAEREQEAVEADRAKRRARIVTMLLCLLWCAVGGALLAWGVMTYDREAGRSAMQIGVELAWAGTILTLVVSYLKAEKRGDR
jgi:hypothetical protein